MNAKSRKIQETHLARPSEGPGWEIWTSGAVGTGAPRLVRQSDTLEGPEIKSLRLVALPAVHLLVFARWLQTTDDSLLPGMVQALLDSQGLAARPGEEGIMAWRTVDREEHRTLVAIRILAGNLPPDWSLERVERYEAGFDLQPLPGNGALLWREGGRMAGAFVRNGQAVHVQSFAGNAITPEMAVEWRCTGLALETTGVLSGCDTVELRGDFSGEDAALLSGVMGVPVQVAAWPEPVWPEWRSGLVPVAVTVLRTRAVRRQRIERVLAGIAVAYVLLVLFLVIQVAWLSFRANQLRSTITSNRSTVETLRATSQRWRALERAVTPTIYPLEVLYQSSGRLPADGVRFTLFEQRDNRVMIRGEANDAAAAFKLLEDIKALPELGYFDWEMPRPNILPNDKAEFQIQGNPPDAPAN